LLKEVSGFSIVSNQNRSVLMIKKAESTAEKTALLSVFLQRPTCFFRKSGVTGYHVVQTLKTRVLESFLSGVSSANSDALFSLKIDSEIDYV
jgi:hypothetical protein